MQNALRLRLPMSVVILMLLAAACAPARGDTGAPRAAPPPAASAAKPEAVAPVAAAPVAAAPAAEAFYRGKTIRILVGYGPGGPFDTFSRVVARYLGQYVPGRPTVIVENKPGAASMLAANQVYASEAKDGTVLANFASGLILLQALGREGIAFDGARYNWLGSAAKTVGACAARVDSGISSIHDLLGPNAKQLVVAAVGPGTATHDMPTALNAVMGTSFKIVSGYDSGTKMVLAIESQEVNGMCSNLDSMSSSARTLLDGDNPIMKIIVVLGSETPNHPWLRGVPAAETLAPNEDARQVLRALHAALHTNLPYAVAPEVPRDRVEALRKALMDTFADPQFRADVEKAGFELDPTPGEELTQVYLGLLNAPPATLARLKEILK
jgi:tripartite-type tricarboxylate transporter receptor subunit TctC